MPRGAKSSTPVFSTSVPVSLFPGVALALVLDRGGDTGTVPIERGSVKIGKIYESTTFRRGLACAINAHDQRTLRVVPAARVTAIHGQPSSRESAFRPV